MVHEVLTIIVDVNNRLPLLLVFFYSIAFGAGLTLFTALYEQLIV